MKPLALVLAVLLAVPAAALRQPPPEETAAMQPVDLSSNADARNVAAASNALGMKVFGRLAEAGPGNIAFSPFSLSAALAMTWTGATGETRAAMARTMELGDDDRRVLDGWKAMLDCFERNGSPLSVANRIYPDVRLPLKLEWQQQLSEAFGSGVRTVDYRLPAAAAAEINAWVKDKTRGHVPSLVGADDFDSETRLALVNAAHYKGAWNSPFPESATQGAAFVLADGSTVKVPTMRQTSHFPYMETPGWQMLSMPLNAPLDTSGPFEESPYTGWRGRVSMLVVLPRAEGSRPSVEREIARPALASMQAGMRSRKVNVALPKFRIEHSMNLEDDLAELGMGLAFTDAAQFGNISDDPLKIDKVIQKAVVKIDEKGAEAAAATAVIMARAAAAPRPEEIVEFRADHPFLWFLVDSQTGAILFAGRVVDPR